MPYVDGVDPNPNDVNAWSRCATAVLAVPLPCLSLRLIVKCARPRSGGGGGGWLGGVDTSKKKTVPRKPVKISPTSGWGRNASGSARVPPKGSSSTWSPKKRNSSGGVTLQEWFGESAYSLVTRQLNALGVEQVDDLLELDRADVEALEEALKKVQAKRFARNLAALAGQTKGSPTQEMKTTFGSHVQMKDDGRWKSASVPAQRASSTPGTEAPDVGRAGGGRGTYVDLAFARAQLQKLEQDLEADLLGWVHMPPIRGAADKTAAAQPEWSSPTKAKQNRLHWDQRLSGSFERLSPEPGEVSQLTAKTAANSGWNPCPVARSDNIKSPQKPFPEVSSRGNLSPRTQRAIVRQRQQRQRQQATSTTMSTTQTNSDQGSPFYNETIDLFGGADTPPMVPPPQLHEAEKQLDMPGAVVSNTPWWWPKELANNPPPRSFHEAHQQAEVERLATLTPSHQWEEEFSNRYQRPYWYHIATRETTWEDPFAPTVVEDASPVLVSPAASSATSAVLTEVPEEPDKEGVAAGTPAAERDVKIDDATPSPACAVEAAEPAAVEAPANSPEQLPVQPLAGLPESTASATKSADAQDQHAAAVPSPIDDDAQREVATVQEEDAAQNDEGNPALWIAARDGRVDAVSKHLLLIMSSGQVSKLAEVAPSDGSTALIVAAQHGHESIVKLLLEVGADWELLDKQGRSAGACAEAAGQVICKEILGAWSHLNAEERESIVSSRNETGRNQVAIEATPVDWERILLEYHPSEAPLDSGADTPAAAADAGHREQEQQPSVPQPPEPETEAELEPSAPAKDNELEAAPEPERASTDSDAGASASANAAADADAGPGDAGSDGGAPSPAVDDEVEQRLMKLGDLSLEAYQELMDENENHPTMEQVEASIAKLLDENPEIAEQEKQREEHHLQKRKTKLGDMSLEALQELNDETGADPSLDQVEAAIQALIAQDPALQAVHDASSSSEEEGDED